MTCVVPGCSGQGLLSFPDNAAEVAEWLKIIPKGEWSLKEESKICVRHFDPTDLIVGSHDGNEYGEYGEDDDDESDCDNEKAEKEDERNGAPEGPSIKLKPGSLPLHSLHFLKHDETQSQEIVLVPEAGPNSGDSELIMEVDEESNRQLDDPLKDDCPSEKPLKPPSPRAYQIIGDNGKSRPKGLKCCVPQCSSSQATTPGVGFHAFPRFGETRISVRTMDNKTVVHDLHLMWKSLLSVNRISSDSFVCTKHFTPHNYTNDTLNKTAVPTQFLPNPMSFAPIMTTPATNNSNNVRVMFNRDKREFQIDPSGQSKHMVRIVGRQGMPPLPSMLTQKPPSTPASPNRLLTSAGSVTIAKKPTVEAKLPSFITAPQLPQITISKVSPNSPPGGHRLILPKLTLTPQPSKGPAVREAYQAVPNATLTPPDAMPKPSLTCSVAGCKSNPHWMQNVTLFRLPRQIERAREWCYLAGHPEWLDQGLPIARIKYRICSNHFNPEMFHNNDKNVLEGWAHPVVEVKASHSKCEVESCLNFFDVDRINNFNVTFFLFPTKSELREKWISAILGGSENADASKRYFGDKSIVCSAHFKNSDFLNVEDPPTLRLLKPGAYPSQRMNSRQSVQGDKEYMMAAVKLSTNPIQARRPMPKRQSVSPPYLRPISVPPAGSVPPPKTTGRNRRCTYRGQVISSWSKVFSEDWYNSDEEDEKNLSAKRIRRRSSTGSKSGGKNDSLENESNFADRIKKEEIEESDESSNITGVPDFTVTLTNGARLKPPVSDPSFQFSPVKVEPSEDGPTDNFVPTITSVDSLSNVLDHGTDLDFFKSLLPALRRLHRDRKDSFKKEVLNCLNRALSS